MYEYEYKSEKMSYEKYRDNLLLFEIKQHEVCDYYSHFHYATEICYVLKGEFSFSVNSKISTVKKGEILFINPTEIHQYYESKNTEVIICIISKEYSSDFITEFGNSAFDNVLPNLEVNSEIHKFLEKAFIAQKAMNFLEKKIFINQIYNLLCRNYIFKKHEETDLFLNKVLEFVYNNYNETLSIACVAKKLSYSETTLSKLFQNKIGVDFRVFVNNIRADMVHRMLHDVKYKDCQLIKIVNDCGFESLATFYRSYKRRFGVLPKRLE